MEVPFSPSRRHPQGDPLSSYLFLICSEGLRTLIHKAEHEGLLHGISICRGASSITHLLFADDCFLSCKVTKNEVEVLKNALHVYEVASDQAINLNKSEVLFCANIHDEKKFQLSSSLGVQQMMGT